MRQLAVIGQRLSVILVLCVFCLCGCEGFRYAATEAQRENAWLHGQVCTMASEAAVDEDASEVLCDLTALAAEQSAAFVIDYGLPSDVEVVDSLDRLLTQGKSAVVTARVEAAIRPDVWTLADGAIELGLALAGLIGGVYGVRVTRYLKTAREKSKALKEIVLGNELFKQLWPEQAERFKEAQGKQSPGTKRLVTEAKTAE